MRVRRLWPAAVLLLAPVLVACGDDSEDGSGDASETPSVTESATPSETPSPSATSVDPTIASVTPETSATGAPAAELPPVCDLITAGDVAKALGEPFEADGRGSGQTQEQDLKWTSDQCLFEADDVAEVRVALTGVDDFSEGAFSCPQPSEIVSIVEPVSDVAGADTAWWKVKEAPPLDAILRACNDTVLIEVKVEYEDGVQYNGDPRNGSIAIAELVLASLQG